MKIKIKTKKPTQLEAYYWELGYFCPKATRFAPCFLSYNLPNLGRLSFDGSRKKTTGPLQFSLLHSLFNQTLLSTIFSPIFFLFLFFFFIFPKIITTKHIGKVRLVRDETEMIENRGEKSEEKTNFMW